MPHNYNVEARDKFSLLPCPDELDYPSTWELKVAKDTYLVACDYCRVGEVDREGEGEG